MPPSLHCTQNMNSSRFVRKMEMEISPARCCLLQRFATRRASTQEMKGQQKTRGGREVGRAAHGLNEGSIQAVTKKKKKSVIT